MSTIRHFSGSREASKGSIAKEILQIEMQKKGKLDPAMRYKMIFKRREEEAKAKVAAAQASNNAAQKGSLVTKRAMSPRAAQALKEMSMKKAAKEAKALRRMVIVQPRNFANGSINKKGQIYDIAGNIIGQVNTKNGRMTTNTGWMIGKYKPKAYMTTMLIQEAINKHSPYFIKLRLMQLQQQALAAQQMMDPMHGNVYGMSAEMAMLAAAGGVYGNIASQEFTNVQGVVDTAAQHFGANASATAWGAMSNNTWGTYSSNVHGTLADNVHGTVGADVWGSVGGSDLWGQRGVRLYGTGNGINMLSGLTKFVLGLFGYQSQKSRQHLRHHRAMRHTASKGISAATARRR